MTSREKAEVAKNAAVEKKAYELMLLDVEKITEISDIFFLCQGKNRIQTQSIADEVMEKLAATGEMPLRKEGYEQGGWILLDYGDLIVHIFMPEEWEYFNLPRLWKDGTIIR